MSQGQFRLNGVTRRLVGVCVIAFVTTSCATQSHAEVELPDKNIDLWVLPLDQYSQQAIDVARADYASVLLEKPCMEAAGYSYPVPWRDLNGLAANPSVNATGRRLFDEELAREYGYGFAPSQEATLAAWIEFDSIVGALGPAARDQLTTCIEQSRLTLPNTNREANWVTGLSLVPYNDSLQDAAVVAAEATWRECMLPLGIRDLPARPVEMPSESLRASFGSPSDTFVSATEVDVAVSDARCQETSGYREALYEAEWNLQIPVLEKNLDALQRNKDVLDANAEIVDGILNSSPGA